MSATYPDPLHNQRGIGLIAAIFIIVVVGMFSVLLARYTLFSSPASAEDYLWAQALYSAEAGARRAILADDGGGGGPLPTPQVANFTLTVSGPTTLTPSTSRQVTVQAQQAGVSREIEVRYQL